MRFSFNISFGGDNQSNKTKRGLGKDSKLFNNLFRMFSPNGNNMNEQTAMSLSAVGGCVRILSTGISGLPMRIQREENGSKITVSNHQASKLFNFEANPFMGAIAWKELMMKEALLHGNGWSIIQRNDDADPVAFLPVPDDDVIVLIKNRKVFYQIRNSKNELFIPSEDMFHLMGLSPDGIRGWSTIRANKENLSLTKFALNYGVDFYAKNATPKGILHYDGDLNDQTKKNVGETWDEMYRPGGNSTGVLDGGWAYTQLSLPPEDAQYLGTRRFQTNEIATIFGVPSYMLNEMNGAKFNNIELQQTDLVTRGLMPWVNRFEEEIERKLFAESEKRILIPKFNVNALLRGDLKTRTEHYRIMTGIGAYNINEVRAFEDMNPIEGGEVYRVAMNTEPIKEEKDGNQEKSE